jgi:hypothetical protein
VKAVFTDSVASWETWPPGPLTLMSKVSLKGLLPL